MDFHFLVMEKSWKIRVEKERAPCSHLHSNACFFLSVLCCVEVKLLILVVLDLFQGQAGSILSVESNRNVESKTEKCGVQNSIWSVDSQEDH